MAALVKLDVLETLLALAVGGGGGVPSVPVRSQVPSSGNLSHPVTLTAHPASLVMYPTDKNV